MRSLKMACAMLMLGGCGTYVPNLQVYPGAVESDLVRAIAASVRCEMSVAVTRLIGSDKARSEASEIPRTLSWLDDWGVQVSLRLEVEENTRVNPTFSWSPTNEFTLGGGVSASSTAGRTTKLNYLYSVGDLYDDEVSLDSDLNSESKYCEQRLTSPGIIETPLIRSDLKIYEALESYTFSTTTGTITDSAQRNTPGQQNNFTHEVKFQLVASGTMSPRWILSESRINPSGSVLSASRTRTHKLIATFGPIDSTGSLAQSAASSFFAAQINAEIE